MRAALRPYLPAALLFATILASAPFGRDLRDLLLAALPAGTDLRVLVVAIGAVLAFAGLAAAARIRERRGLRWSALVAAGLLVVAQDRLYASGLAASDLAEKLHVVEYGLLAYLLARPLRDAGDLSAFLRPLFWIGAAGALDEGVQWLAPRRYGELRDVGLDVVCGLAGLLVALAVAPPRTLRLGIAPENRAPTARAASALVLAVGLFASATHLGHRIDDPEVGRFRSWLTAGELRAASRDRARRWAESMPTEVPLWGIEDRFLSEAADHAMLRNAAWQQGDFLTSWRENRILELYFPAFLDLLSFQSRQPHRLPDAAREALERRAKRAYPLRSESPVLRGRLATWPSRPVGVAATLSLALLLAAVPRKAARRDDPTRGQGGGNRRSTHTR